jgi:superfamily I DNA/RNA helicase
MTFLHPEQLRLIRRIGPGPSRIRGAAGTGKTVVALHRAAYLAESLAGPILFTTFVRTLPPVLDGLYRRLSPTTDSRLEFVNLHRWSGDLLRARGHRVRVDLRSADFAFSRAWGRHGKGSALADLGVPWRYWKDEIEYVIKGRGITDFADYASLKRVGRRTRLLPAHREIVWSIYADYEQQLREAGIVDANDLLNLALAAVRDKPLDQPYAAVIADEMQDLNCQAARLLAEISGGGERLLLIGDGQQQIYPGGYSLVEAGIAISGRSTVLRVNYRNAAEILNAAAQVVADDEYDDLEGATESGRREVNTVRTGGRVWRSSAATADALRADALAHVQALLADGADLAGIAILCGTNDEVDQYVRLLAQAGIPALPLTKYLGVPVEAVKVGTVQRAKGLEFKHVIHPVTHRDTPKKASEDAIREQRELANRTLFVAMTRARDSIWLGSVA